MAHWTAPDVTSKAAPAIHAGLNAHTSVYSLEAKTITGSQSIAMIALPGGARVGGRVCIGCRRGSGRPSAGDQGRGDERTPWG